MLLTLLDMIALCIYLTWGKPAYIFISPTSTNIPYVNVTEQFSSKAVMFVLINLSICLLIIIDIFTHLNKFVSCKLGSCITFIVNLTYCILPNELTFRIKYPNYTLI